MLAFTRLGGYFIPWLGTLQGKKNFVRGYSVISHFGGDINHIFIVLKYQTQRNKK